MSDVLTLERNPRAAKAACDQVLQAVADFDFKAQLAVLRNARTMLRRQYQKKAPRRKTPGKHHAVTLGLHDAEIVQGRADGLSSKRMADQFGCGPTCVEKRVRVLSQ